MRTLGCRFSVLSRITTERQLHYSIKAEAQILPHLGSSCKATPLLALRLLPTLAPSTPPSSLARESGSKLPKQRNTVVEQTRSKENYCTYKDYRRENTVKGLVYHHGKLQVSKTYAPSAVLRNPIRGPSSSWLSSNISSTFFTGAHTLAHSKCNTTIAGMLSLAWISPVSPCCTDFHAITARTIPSMASRRFISTKNPSGAFGARATRICVRSCDSVAARGQIGGEKSGGSERADFGGHGKAFAVRRQGEGR
jgi:hypothetical protein